MSPSLCQATRTVRDLLAVLVHHEPMQSPPDPRQLVEDVTAWYLAHARDLPWRRPGTTAWAIVISEVMLQQTPVARVVEPYLAWIARWPTPSCLAQDPPGAAVAAWGRLGYPRRALRLHEAAVAIAGTYGDVVPDSYETLRGLPGIGDYTASAVLSFAYGQALPVLDTNVRRVLARVRGGVAYPAPSLTVAERLLAMEYVSAAPELAPTWAAASMELGAVVCTAKAPDCGACPVESRCAWRAAGRPAWDGPPRRGQAWQGTDRQCRGVLLAAVRDGGPAHRETLLALWTDREQAERCLFSLLADRLLTESDLVRL